MRDAAIHSRPAVWYVAFDKKTGRIVHTHSRFSVEANRHVEVPDEDLRRMLASDASLLSDVTDHDIANLDILMVGPHDGVPSPGSAMIVDVAHRKVVPKPTLEISADKREILGDGKDSATIEIRAVNEHGKVLGSITDRVKVTVTRGKLSSRGGIVELVEGRATITLTSVNETVEQVRVGATSLTGACGNGRLIVEFV